MSDIPELPPWHDLLAAITETLDVPRPADYDDMPAYHQLVQSRVSLLRGYLGGMVTGLHEPDIGGDGIRRMAKTAPATYTPDTPEGRPAQAAPAREDGMTEPLQLEKDTPAGATSTPPVGDRSEVPAAAAEPFLVYRAHHGAIGLGYYSTTGEAREHCEMVLSANYPEYVSMLHDWIGDGSDPLGPVKLVVRLVGGDEEPTGFTVTPIEIAAPFDPDAAQ